MACFFRQAEHKCQDFMIFLPGGNHLASTDQRISKMCCPSALQRSSRDPSSGTTISSFASKPGILLLQQPRGSTQVPEKKKKKKRWSPISHQFKHYSSNSALPIPCPLAGDLPSTSWCTGPACGHFLWKKDWRWKLAGERPQQRPRATNCPANHPCFYRLLVLKSSACEFG